MSGIFSNGGVGAAISVVMERLASISNGMGAALVAFKNRTVQDKLLDSLNARDYGAIGNGAANDTAAVMAGVGAMLKKREYAVTSYDNPLGVDATPDGVAHNRTSGRVYNPRQQFTARTFGQETLQHWFSMFAGASNKNTGDNVIRRIVISGPSTIFGVGATYGTPSALLEDLAETRGYTNVGVINRGQSGKATFDWLSTYLDGDLAASPDLLVLQWPVNDPYFGRTVEQSIADFRTGLARIRAARGVDVLSIAVMTPAPMNDVEKGRTEAWAEQIGAGLRQAAADFDCAFFDTYGYFQNAHSAAGLWMDKDTSFNPAGRAIHPHDVFYEHIFGQLADLIYPDWGTNWRANAVRNTSAGDVQSVKTGMELPEMYFSGIGMHRMGDVTGTPEGAPYDGAAFTFKQADGAIMQFSIPLATGGRGSGISARIGFGNAWSDWYGQKKQGSALLVGGWHNLGAPFAAFAYRLMMEGTLSLSGHIGVGASTVDGTIIFQLPGGYCPLDDEIILIGTENGTCRLRIGTDGTARIYGFGAGGGYVILSGAGFAL